MKLFCLIATMSMAFAGSEANPGLTEIKTVYLLPMTYSLDQFLAIRLTRGGILQVVTDPNRADAILSEHIGLRLRESPSHGESPRTDRFPCRSEISMRFWIGCFDRRNHCCLLGHSRGRSSLRTICNGRGRQIVFVREGF